MAAGLRSQGTRKPVQIQINVVRAVQSSGLLPYALQISGPGRRPPDHVGSSLLGLSMSSDDFAIGWWGRRRVGGGQFTDAIRL